MHSASAFQPQEQALFYAKCLEILIHSDTLKETTSFEIQSDETSGCMPTSRIGPCHTVDGPEVTMDDVLYSLLYAS